MKIAEEAVTRFAGNAQAEGEFYAINVVDKVMKNVRGVGERGERSVLGVGVKGGKGVPIAMEMELIIGVIIVIIAMGKVIRIVFNAREEVIKIVSIVTVLGMRCVIIVMETAM